MLHTETNNANRVLHLSAGSDISCEVKAAAPFICAFQSNLLAPLSVQFIPKVNTEVYLSVYYESKLVIYDYYSLR